jgi:hypothetical protein
LLGRFVFSSIDEAGDCGGVEYEVKSEVADSGGVLNWHEVGESMRMLLGLNCGSCEGL